MNQSSTKKNKKKAQNQKRNGKKKEKQTKQQQQKGRKNKKTNKTKETRREDRRCDVEGRRRPRENRNRTGKRVRNGWKERERERGEERRRPGIPLGSEGRGEVRGDDDDVIGFVGGSGSDEDNVSVVAMLDAEILAADEELSSLVKNLAKEPEEQWQSVYLWTVGLIPERSSNGIRPILTNICDIKSIFN